MIENLINDVYLKANEVRKDYLLFEVYNPLKDKTEKYLYNSRLYLSKSYLLPVGRKQVHALPCNE